MQQEAGVATERRPGVFQAPAGLYGATEHAQSPPLLRSYPARVQRSREEPDLAVLLCTSAEVQTVPGATPSPSVSSFCSGTHPGPRIPHDGHVSSVSPALGRFSRIVLLSAYYIPACASSSCFCSLRASECLVSPVSRASRVPAVTGA